MKSSGLDSTDLSDDNNAIEQEYEVEKIVDSKIYQKKIQYKIRWKGYTPSEDTWETSENLTACDECINNYLSQESQKDKQRIRAKRELTGVLAVQYGIINEASEISYHVITNDGKEKDLTSMEMRMNYPYDLLKFLEKTSFKNS